MALPWNACTSCCSGWDPRDPCLAGASLRPEGREGRRVINRTGLTGPFEIHVEFEYEAANSYPPDDAAREPGSSFIVAIRKQLGLRLDPGKGPREFLVIDHVERPSEN